MFYNELIDLPEILRANLPKKALDLYFVAFNQAYAENRDELLSSNIAWKAVKEHFLMNDKGHWLEKLIEK